MKLVVSSGSILRVCCRSEIKRNCISSASCSNFLLIKNFIKAVMKWHVHIWLFLISRLEQTSVTTASELNISTYNTTTSFIQACICKGTKNSRLVISDHCNQKCWHTMYKTGYTCMENWTKLTDSLFWSNKTHHEDSGQEISQVEYFFWDLAFFVQRLGFS